MVLTLCPGQPGSAVNWSPADHRVSSRLSAWISAAAEGHRGASAVTLCGRFPSSSDACRSLPGARHVSTNGRLHSRFCPSCVEGPAAGASHCPVGKERESSRCLLINLVPVQNYLLTITWLRITACRAERCFLRIEELATSELRKSSLDLSEEDGLDVLRNAHQRGLPWVCLPGCLPDLPSRSQFPAVVLLKRRLLHFCWQQEKLNASL